jgi:pyrroloquinoline quinone biosynthesis protein B
MRLEILGSAAGGGFPRGIATTGTVAHSGRGHFPGKSRTQTQVAVSDDGRSWFLLNASPDLRMQVERTPFLQPRSPGRDFPIAGVLLTSGLSRRFC